MNLEQHTTPCAQSHASYPLDDRRAMLLSVRMQFAPETQPVRETAVEKFLEQVIYALDSGDGVSLADIRDLLVVGSQRRQVFADADIRAALTRLEGSGRVVVKMRRPFRVALMPAIQNEVHATHALGQSQTRRALAGFFSHLGARHAEYESALLDFLCVVFLQLSEDYVHLLKGRIQVSKLAGSSPFHSALRFVRRKYTNLDGNVVRVAAVRFFESAHPDVVALKWNLAQNHYIFQCIGLDRSGDLLSREMFGDATLYLDTNVLIRALDGLSDEHRSFKLISRACTALNIKLQVCQVSLDQMRKVVSYQRQEVPRLASKVPDETSGKVRNVFYELYRHRKSADPLTDDPFAIFDRSSDELRAQYAVSIVDDVWFDNEHSDVIQRLGKSVADAAARRGRSKSPTSARHDAQLLGWAALERETGNTKAWVLTMDRTLPDVAATDDGAAVAITLDALLQWISAASPQNVDEDSAAELFSDCIRYNVLPVDTFFDLNDFRVFDELSYDTRTLPADDVEECLRTLKRQTSGLDMTNPRARERAARLLAKYFVDPARRHNRELERLRSENSVLNSRTASLSEELASVHAAGESRVGKLGREIAALREQVENLIVDNGSKQSELVKVTRATKTIRRVLAGTAASVTTGSAVTVGIIWGEGTNIVQQLMNSGPLIGIAITASALLMSKILDSDDLGIFGRRLASMRKPLEAKSTVQD